jgi:hypothetical protein
MMKAASPSPSISARSRANRSVVFTLHISGIFTRTFSYFQLFQGFFL